MTKFNFFSSLVFVSFVACGGGSSDNITDGLLDGGGQTMMTTTISKDAMMSDDSMPTTITTDGGVSTGTATDAGGGTTSPDGGTVVAATDAGSGTTPAPTPDAGGGTPSPTDVMSVIRRLNNVPKGVFAAYQMYLPPNSPPNVQNPIQNIISHKTAIPIGKLCFARVGTYYVLQVGRVLTKWTTYSSGIQVTIFRPLVQSEVDALKPPALPDDSALPIGIDTWMERNKDQLDAAIDKVNAEVSLFSGCK